MQTLVYEGKQNKTYNRKNTYMTATNNKFSGTVYVCQHRVTFEYWDFESELTPELEDRLTNEAEERSKAMITEGYASGELNDFHPDTEEEIRGWWTINSGS